MWCQIRKSSEFSEYKLTFNIISNWSSHFCKVNQYSQFFLTTMWRRQVNLYFNLWGFEFKTSFRIQFKFSLHLFHKHSLKNIENKTTIAYKLIYFVRNILCLLTAKIPAIQTPPETPPERGKRLNLSDVADRTLVAL